MYFNKVYPHFPFFFNELLSLLRLSETQIQLSALPISNYLALSREFINSVPQFLYLKNACHEKCWSMKTPVPNSCSIHAYFFVCDLNFHMGPSLLMFSSHDNPIVSRLCLGAPII